MATIRPRWRGTRRESATSRRRRDAADLFLNSSFGIGPEFAQLGAGDERVTRFSSYAGLGFAFVGVIPARLEDELGLAYGVARNSRAFLEQQRALGSAPEAAESTLELTYLAALRPWLSAQASLQRVHNPNTDPALRDARVGQLRFEVVF